MKAEVNIGTGMTEWQWAERLYAETNRNRVGFQRIREMVRRVAEGTATTEQDTLVYQMFGSLTKEEAEGIVIGLTFALSNLP